VKSQNEKILNEFATYEAKIETEIDQMKVSSHSISKQFRKIFPSDPFLAVCNQTAHASIELSFSAKPGADKQAIGFFIQPAAIGIVTCIAVPRL
jgi:hypothetical protein